MKKVILFITGIVIVFSAIVFIVSDLYLNRDSDVNATDYEQQLLSLTKNCELLECGIINDFNRLDKNEYQNNIDDIAESIRPIIYYPNGPKIGTAILNIALQDGKLNENSQLLVLDKIATLRYTDNDLYGMIDPSLKYIEIAHKSGDEFKIATGEFSLALIITYFKGYEFANDIINSIQYKDTSDEWKKLKTRAMLSLAENNLAINKPKIALEIIKNIEQYKTAYNEEDWRDYYVYLLSLRAESYDEIGLIEKANQCLTLAQLELEKDQKILLLDKNILIEVIRFKLALKNRNYLLIENKKEELLKIADRTNQIRFTKLVYSTLFDYYLQTNNLYESYDLNKRYNKLHDERLSASYQLLISNKLKINENSKLNEGRQQSLFFLKIAFIILLVISLLLLMMIFKIKYLNIETYTDPLTRSFNRRKFMIDYEGIEKKDHAFLILDIDDFKKINDSFGHEIGDEVLKKVASEIALILGNNHQSYRIGGEEFVVLFIFMDPQACIKLSEDIRKCVEMLRWDYDLKVTISGGLSFSDKEKNTYKSADELLYNAKRTTKNIILNDSKY
ncbi:GGDEF domain-containing protein [Aliivibrio sp. S3MY1]|uniref:GGDEF domain-containing protein n=1 Tax=unclassified Aliivibrio TaxID=2645654 RepID=UPI002378F42C|nr:MULTISPECIES: GGDEF domain-containing protein [unclassified Aliivibrio]MDD9194303.1 GGDEF domain-containing protein [Aliivibrio sp. S3MY1]MDD9197970.1 GGDEF domain-containing protein [Aliivibrio sp. S2MY1]